MQSLPRELWPPILVRRNGRLLLRLLSIRSCTISTPTQSLMKCTVIGLFRPRRDVDALVKPSEAALTQA
jgi:hypothetical protein